MSFHKAIVMIIWIIICFPDFLYSSHRTSARFGLPLCHGSLMITHMALLLCLFMLFGSLISTNMSFNMIRANALVDKKPFWRHFWGQIVFIISYTEVMLLLDWLKTKWIKTKHLTKTWKLKSCNCVSISFLFWKLKNQKMMSKT